MRTEARFPTLERGRGHYESFYLKLTRPGGGEALWIRHTVHRRPGEALTGSVWFTHFDRDAAGPIALKTTVAEAEVSVPPGGFIDVAGTVLEPGHARGALAAGGSEARWELRFAGEAPAFHHLPYARLYEAPLPKTKLLSPYPDARFDGAVTVGAKTIEVGGWPGMVGHNWGREHAERWIWTQANDFEAEEACFDAGLGRIRVGRWTTPWIANALLTLDGERHRLGGLDRIRSTRVAERPASAEFELTGKGIRVRGEVAAEPGEFVGWIYADPVGPEHNTVNCSIATMTLTVERKGEAERRLTCRGAAAYELGMRETDHGIAIQPYPDG